MVPHQQAGHMTAIAPSVRAHSKPLASQGPSTHAIPPADDRGSRHLAAICARHAAGEVRSPSGLLRRMVRLHRAGKLKLDRTLFGPAKKVDDGHDDERFLRRPVDGAPDRRRARR